MLMKYKMSSTSFFTAPIHTWSFSAGLMRLCFIPHIFDNLSAFLSQNNNKLYFFLFNSLLNGNSGLLKKIVHARIALSASYRKCWTAEFIEACEGLYASDRYINCFKAASPLLLQDLVVDLRE